MLPDERTRSRRGVRRWRASLALLFVASCATPGDGSWAGSVLRSVDNDLLDDSDDQYTSGVSLSFIARQEVELLARAIRGYPGGSLDSSRSFRTVFQLRTVLVVASLESK